MTSRRTLGHAEAELMIGVGLGLLLLCAVAVVWPRIVAFPLAAIGAWLAVSLFVTAYRLKRIVKKERQAEAVRTGT
jgi:cardiolipin synthase